MSSLLTEGQYFGWVVQDLENEFFKLTKTHYLPETDIEEHYHENNYISLLINGGYVEQYKKDNALIEAGNIIFRPAGYNHSNNFGQAGGACFNIEFKYNWQQNIDFGLQLPAKHTIYKTGSLPSIYKLLYFFNHAFNKPAEENIYFEFVLDWLFQINKQVPVKSKLAWIEKVMSIIESEPGIHHTIHSLAARVFTHPIYLARAFKEKTGFTIGEYQLKAKLDKAMVLLFNTNFPVNDIAFETGFTDAARL
jgi:AraC-like DNA-binding protein